MGEVVVLVDTSGNVIGSAPRDVVRRDNLLHAATAVLVRNSAREVYLHRRAHTKDWAPGSHDCAAGGLLREGEKPEESAARELAEELGISGVSLRAIGTSLFEDDSARCFAYCYETTWDGPVTHIDDEVVWGEWVTLSALAGLLRRPDFDFVPDTRHTLTRLAAESSEYAVLTDPVTADRT